MLNRTLILWLIAILPSSIAAAATVELQDALRRAASANPSVTRALADVDLATAHHRLAQSAILPHVAIDASATHNSEEIFFNSTAIQPRTDWSSRLTLKQTLYAGGRELKAIRQMGLQIDAARAGSRSTEELVVLRTATDYLGVVEADALIEVEKQNVQVAAERRKRAAEMLRVGEVTKVDVLRAEAAQKAAERELAAAQQRRHAAESQLRLDLSVDSDLEVVPPALTFPTLPSSTELAEKANVTHPDLLRSNASVQIARLETRKQFAAWLPTVTANASFNRQKTAFPSDHGGALSISMHLPIFDSGEIASRGAMARESEKQVLASAKEIRQGVREEIDRAVVALETARKSYDLAKEQLAATQGEYDQIAALYKAQEATSLDIDAAESALAEARRFVVTGSLQKQLAELRVWFAAGSLKSILLEEGH